MGVAEACTGREGGLPFFGRWYMLQNCCCCWKWPCLIWLGVWWGVADDRGVRDSERKAAVMHFDTDQVGHVFIRGSW